MPVCFKYLLIPSMVLSMTNLLASPPVDSIPSPVVLAEQLLYGTRTGKPVVETEMMLRDLDPALLEKALQDPDLSLAFWLNIYNGFTQMALQRNPALYQQRGKFFRSKQFILAGQRISLDQIEHGIIRSSAVKWGLGYLRNPFPGRFEKKFRLKKTDPRIHFALNCGAKSCPPIAYYQAAQLHRQLDLATRNYLKSEVRYDSLTNRVMLPVIFSWFRGDFGGRKKIYQLLESYNLIPAGSRPSIRYNPYNWELTIIPEAE
jgi:Protein of unknown function, DUF547